MLASISTILRLSLTLVRLRSRLLTALNLLPSIATTVSEKRFSCWPRTTNWRQTFVMDLPLSLQKQDPFAQVTFLHGLGR